MYKNRWYQDEAIWAIFNYFEKGNKGNPVIAMPTGTGKSVVIADFIKRVMQQYPSQRIISLTHVKKLIEQNTNKLKALWDTAPMGIYSAGMSQRDRALPVIYGGIQSVAPALKRGESFGKWDLVVIDEAHLLSPKDETQYQYVIGEFKKINPYLKVIGLTATPYRLKQGLITEAGSIFTDICYDITNKDAFSRLIGEGFLCPLISRPTEAVINTAGMKITASDFNSADAETEAERIIYEGLKETCKYGHDRKRWLIFAAGIKNAEHIAEMLGTFGIDAIASHSKLSEAENERRLAAFERGEVRALVGMNKFTTGYDNPEIDLIADFQPTVSTGKYVQKAGRGIRPFAGKQNCLYLDFAGNVKRLGPVDDPVLPHKPSSGKKGEAPVKICPQCGIYDHASVRICGNCGFEYKFETKILKESYAGQIMSAIEEPKVESFEVKKVIYNLHEKKNKEGILLKPPSIRVSYFCAVKMYEEWICFEHGKEAHRRAREWWMQRHSGEPPFATFQALKQCSQLRVPKRIRVHTNKKPYPEIVGFEWD